MRNEFPRILDATLTSPYLSNCPYTISGGEGSFLQAGIITGIQPQVRYI